MVSLWLCICLLAGCFGVGIPGMKVQAADKVRVVGYLPSYRSYAIDSIDYSALTHLNLSFITYANGALSCDFSDADVAKIREKCNANNVKLLIALGGGGGFDVSSGNPFETAEKRTALINSLMGYVEKWQLDGIDIDIELGEGTSLWRDFDTFISELSARLKAENKLLTMALAMWFAGDIQNSTYTYFDFVNLMTYDENAGNGPVASQKFVDDTVAYFQGKGISADRMTIGVPFYGYGSGGWGDAYTYAQILSMNREAALHADEYNGIYYNGADTIRSKTEYSKNYGGIMIWELAQDAGGDDSLLKLIKDTLGDAIGDPTDSDSSTGGDVDTGKDEDTPPAYEAYEVADGDYYLSCSQDGTSYKVVTAVNDTAVALAAVNEGYTGTNDILVLMNNTDGTVSFRSAVTGKYICADMNHGGLLLPRSDSVDTWEKFNLVKVTDTQCALFASANNKYVAADFENGGKLTAMSDSVAGAWEAFILTEAPQKEENTENSGSTEESTENVDSTEGENTENSGTNDEKQEGTGTYAAWSATGHYNVGDFVSYDGKVYECILGHDANSAWIPGAAGLETIWKLRTDLVHAEDGTAGGDDNGTTDEDNNGTTGGDNGGTTGGDNNGETDEDNNGTIGGNNGGTTGGDNSGTTGGDNSGTTGGDNSGETDEDNNGTTGGTTGGGNSGTTGGDNSGETDEDNNGTTGGDNGGTTGGGNSGTTGGDNSGTTGGDNSGETDEDNNGTTGGDNSGTTGGNNSGTTGGDNSGETEEDNNGITGGDNGGTTGGNNSGTTGENNSGTTGGNNSGTTGGNNSGTTEGNNSGTTGGNNSGTTGGDNSGTTGGNNSGTTGGDNNGTTGGNNSGSTGGSNSGENVGSNAGVTGGNNIGTNGNTNAGTTEETIDSVVAGVSSLTAVTKLLEANTTDEDVNGSTYITLGLRVTKVTNTSHKLKWNKVASADGYVILMSKCGERLKVAKTITNGKTTSWNKKKLKKATYYKYVVVAYKMVNGKQITISTSKLIHVPTNGGKYTDIKSVKVNKASVRLKMGKTFKIKAKEVKKVSSRKISRHRKLCYESTNEAVATVSKSGKITAKSKGKCYIYVYAQNGVSKKVKLTVK